MQTFISDLLPKLKKFSKRLDNWTLLKDKHWIVIDSETSKKIVYMFRDANQLLISNNGKVEKGKWELIGLNSLLIDIKNDSFLFKHAFLDESILILKLDGKKQYVFLVDEDIHFDKLNSSEDVTSYLSEKYESEQRREANIPVIFNTKDLYPSVDLNDLRRFKIKDEIIYIEGRGRLKGRKVFDKTGKNVLKNGKYKISFMCFIHVNSGKITNVTAF